MADIQDLEPVTRPEFAANLAPCLALASGVGMSKEDQRVWLNAAFKALDGIPIGLLKRGCDAALKTADHPSKIVPAIIREVQEDWDWRRKHRAGRPQPTPVAEREIPEAERAKVSQTMGDLLKRMQSNIPTLDTVLGKQA